MKTEFVSIPGINIQWPWSSLLLSGKKTVETRTYPLPEKYKGSWLAVLETPGPTGKKHGINETKIVGLIRFEKSRRYASKREWEMNSSQHLVALDDLQFGWNFHKQKWAWEVAEVRTLKEPVNPPVRRGIVFATSCRVPKTYFRN